MTNTYPSPGLTEDSQKNKHLNSKSSQALVQEKPITIQDENNETHAVLKVDSISTHDETLEICGWHIGTGELKLLRDGVSISHEAVRNKRFDVATALKTPEPDSGFGFTLKTTFQWGEHALELLVPIQGKTKRFTFPLSLAAKPAMLPPSEIKPLGFIETAASSTISGDTVIVGWAIHHKKTDLWVEDESGTAFSLEKAFRLFRQDVHDAYGTKFSQANPETGFILRARGFKPNSKLRLVAKIDNKHVILCEASCSALPDEPVAASRWLFGLYTPNNRLHERFPLVDIPIITALKERQQKAWKDLPVHTQELGCQIEQPVISIIIPLFGRTDFVENQLIEFSRDLWLKENSEVIYVIDDPSILSSFREDAESFYRLYGIPFRWVWGGVNRGFSGANNLGAQNAKGHYFIFLNSDAFPVQPGWIYPLVQTLSTRPQVGAIAPQLAFPDGSIQHCGMDFIRREELGIWINHHPYMGVDCSLDPHRSLASVPAVTGACLVVSRENFYRINGWDSGYLIGDFEDSDLCLKLRSIGLDIAYLPTVQLIHLERQSFKSIGQDDFRSKVVLYNAVRHQARWVDLIKACNARGNSEDNIALL